MEEFYERRLPHWQPEDTYLFVTWRLEGSLRPDFRYAGKTPGHAFVAVDRELAKTAIGPTWLADERIAQIVAEALHYGATQLKRYELYAWVIMPNHVHFLIHPHVDLSKIMRTVKGFTARQANQILGFTGNAFWQRESYDHWVRDEREFNKIVEYIEMNPVKAELVAKPEDWPWSSAGLMNLAGLAAYPTKEKNA